MESCTTHFKLICAISSLSSLIYVAKSNEMLFNIRNFCRQIERRSSSGRQVSQCECSGLGHSRTRSSVCLSVTRGNAALASPAAAAICLFCQSACDSRSLYMKHPTSIHQHSLKKCGTFRIRNFRFNPDTNNHNSFETSIVVTLSLHCCVTTA